MAGEVTRDGGSGPHAVVIDERERFEDNGTVSRKPDIPSLKDLLPHVLGKLAKEGDARTLHPVWTQVVGEQAAKYSKPHALKDGALEIHVEGSSWMDALSRQAPDILARLQARLGRKTVVKLVFFQT